MITKTRRQQTNWENWEDSVIKNFLFSKKTIAPVLINHFPKKIKRKIFTHLTSTAQALQFGRA